MDAQYGCLARSKSDVDRDLIKAFAAFGVCPSVSTGRWGAGMFAKDPDLTFLQQFLAGSERSLMLVLAIQKSARELFVSCPPARDAVLEKCIAHSLKLQCNIEIGVFLCWTRFGSFLNNKALLPSCASVEWVDGPNLQSLLLAAQFEEATFIDIFFFYVIV